MPSTNLFFQLALGFPCHRVRQRPLARQPSQRPDSGDSAETEGWKEEIAPGGQMAGCSARERTAPAARSAWTPGAPPRAKAGTATAERLRLRFPRVPASLIALVLQLLDHPILILPVPAANQRSLLSPAKMMVALNNGRGWVPASTHPTRTGLKWTPTST